MKNALLLLSALVSPAGSGTVLAAPPAAGDELAEVERALEDAPDDPALLERAAGAALAAGDADRALWYANLALERAGDDSKAVQRLSELRAGLGLPEGDAEAVLEEYAESLFKLSKTCVGRKLYANAVDLLSLCRGTRFEEDAEERLERIFDNNKAVAALLESGLDVPVKQKLRLGPEEIARLDAKHAAWDDAYEVKGEYYTVRTNMGYEMAHAMSEAMEQMNTFYRAVFGYKERGGSMRRCVLNVFATRAEFDAHGDKDPGVKGYFSPLENSVTTYDPRTEPSPLPLSELWGTLFHESSHQFTVAVWPNLIPTWLNEGTASYFEGARLLPNGTVAFNGIPDRRLRNLVILLDRGSPSVKDVVTYYKPGSYPGEYYPFGWGLVYFCLNYEDEHSERVYRPVYEEFMKSYKGSAKHDVLERFVEYFVEEPGIEGVETFDDFVALWQGWIRDLHRIHFGGPDQADELIARAARQRAAGKLEPAVESLRWALRKRPDDPAALAALAEVLVELDRPDAALFCYRDLAEIARAVPDGTQPLEGAGERTAAAVLGSALDGIEDVDGTVADLLAKAEASFVESSSGVARVLADAGFPRGAVQLLETSQTVLGGHGGLAALARELGGGLDLRRWRRLAVDGDLERWTSKRDWSSRDDGTLALQTDGLVVTTYREKPPRSFRYEGRVRLGSGGELPVVGLAFGAGLDGGETLFAHLPKSNLVGLISFVDGEPEMTQRFQSVPRAESDGDSKDMLFAMEVRGRRAEFFVDGQKVGEVSGSLDLRGRVGVFGQDTAAEFFDLRLKY